MLIKSPKLHRGDTVCALSLSWGGAGDPELLWRYQLGKARLKEVFGLNVIELSTTLAGSAYVYQNPKQRAQDLMAAFANPEIKAIFSCIGGEDSIRMLPYIDFEIIKHNPKPFIGYSDSTITHLMCYKAGITSFYGPSILAEFAENIKIMDYTTYWAKQSLFSNLAMGEIPCAPHWTGEYLAWTQENKLRQKELQQNQGYIVLQGVGKARGRLIGGCMDVLEFAKGTCLFPPLSAFEGAILFLETSEDTPTPLQLRYWLRNYAAMGILHKINGILFAKPYQEVYFNEYQQEILKVLAEEQVDIPVLYNASFGHNEPMCVLIYGALAEIDCDAKNFSILESGVY